jgi:23S rRNA (cytidine1920-2'-O)/16S rRNA (cytidine1409-2'-O)-methyltransferase
MTSRQRIDRLLVARGLFESRAKAQAAIAAGGVTADGVTIGKVSEPVALDAVLYAEPAHPYVSRGGAKLAGLLDQSGLAVADRVALDVGASTGGFTEVLIGRGTRLVYAVDVGHGQLHQRLRQDPRVVSLESTDIRALDPARLEPRPDLVVIDASFISLELILPAALACATPRIDLIALIKPQFEVARRNIKKGIVRDPTVQVEVCDRIAGILGKLGLQVSDMRPAVINGRDGNREFFVVARR